MLSNKIVLRRKLHRERWKIDAESQMGDVCKKLRFVKILRRTSCLLDKIVHAEEIEETKLGIFSKKNQLETKNRSKIKMTSSSSLFFLRAVYAWIEIIFDKNNAAVRNVKELKNGGKLELSPPPARLVSKGVLKNPRGYLLLYQNWIDAKFKSFENLATSSREKRGKKGAKRAAQRHFSSSRAVDC